MALPPDQNQLRALQKNQLLQAKAEIEGRVLRNRVVPPLPQAPKEQRPKAPPAPSFLPKDLAPKPKPAAIPSAELVEETPAVNKTAEIPTAEGKEKMTELQRGYRGSRTPRQYPMDSKELDQREGHSRGPSAKSDRGLSTVATGPSQDLGGLPRETAILLEQQLNQQLQQQLQQQWQQQQLQQQLQQQQQQIPETLPVFGSVAADIPTNEGAQVPNETRPTMGAYPNYLPETESILRTVQGSNLQLQLIVAAVRESVREILSRESTQVRKQINPNPSLAGRKAPPLFEGAGAKTWLMQIENYHDMIGLPLQDRARDAVSYLTGRAIREYVFETERGRQPHTWEEFKRWVFLRFPVHTEHETLRRLLALRWEGSLDKFCAQFMTVLSEGISPIEYEVTRIFIKALPAELIMMLKDRKFDSWVEIRDYLTERLASRRNWAMLWSANVSEATLRDAEKRWPHHFPPQQHYSEWKAPGIQPLEKRNEGGNGSYPNNRVGNKPAHALVNIAPSTNTAANRNANVSKISCHTCNGVGHVARVCPNTNPQLLKEGSTCGRCRGNGHWARACPSPPMTTGTIGNNVLKRGSDNGEGKGPVQTAQKGLGNGKA